MEARELSASRYLEDRAVSRNAAPERHPIQQSIGGLDEAIGDSRNSIRTGERVQDRDDARERDLENGAAVGRAALTAHSVQIAVAGLNERAIRNGAVRDATVEEMQHRHDAGRCHPEHRTSI